MDLSYLNAISDGDEEFIAQFIETFEHNTAAILTEMDKAFAESNFDKLQKSAHQLKPSLEMLKLDTYDICLNIQDKPEQTTVEDIQSIREECNQSTQKMKVEFNLSE